MPPPMMTTAAPDVPAVRGAPGAAGEGRGVVTARKVASLEAAGRGLRARPSANEGRLWEPPLVVPTFDGVATVA